MNLKKLILASLLLAIGVVLHYAVPGLPLGSMKPDALLAMMFVAILLCDDYKLTLMIGIASGFLTAMTTTFPGGQLPNIIDKIITSHVIYFLLKATKGRVNLQIRMSLTAILGTLLSGYIFLGSALLLFGLPAPFNALFVSVVIPATVANTVLVLLMCNAVGSALRRTTFKFN